MRVKIDRLMAGRGELPESEYAPILAFPEIIDSTTKHLTILPNIPKRASGTDKFRVEVATLVRTITNTPETESVEPRKSKQRPKGAMTNRWEDDEEGIEEDEEDEAVDPRLREIVKEVGRLEKASEGPSDLDVEDEEGEDEDKDELGALLKEGEEGIEEDEDKESSESEEGDEGEEDDDMEEVASVEEDADSVDEVDEPMA